MKAKYILVGFLTLSLLTGCADSFLSNDPHNGTLLEDQYNQLDDAIEGSVRGIYSRLYRYTGHDGFGLRSIDMYGDFNAGDLGMTTNRYGWFRTDDQGLMYAYRKSYIWSFYYNIIYLCNNCINQIETLGVPSLTPDEDTLTDEDVILGQCYGQVLALRGWAYAGLMRYFSNPDVAWDAQDEIIPIYTETQTADVTVIGAPLATQADVNLEIVTDLTTGIDYLNIYEQYLQQSREGKLYVNSDLAYAFLAYAYLNMGRNEEALAAARTVIERGNFTILPNLELLSTGFYDVENDSWMWGLDVSVLTATALGSFFGQVDVYTYSYAAAGDVKGIDSKLLLEIQSHPWDGRVDWFRISAPFVNAPAGKFYCPSTKNEAILTDPNMLAKVDRNWLGDQVFMRIESVYLTAAEACYHLNKTDSAVYYLDQIMSQRLRLDETGKKILPEAQTQYDTYKATLVGGDALKEAIVYNWRVELWGEGYGMQTLRRLTKSQTLGTNHIGSRKNATVSIADGQEFVFNIPTSENRYNPYIAYDEFAEKDED